MRNDPTASAALFSGTIPRDPEGMARRFAVARSRISAGKGGNGKSRFSGTQLQTAIALLEVLQTAGTRDTEQISGEMFPADQRCSEEVSAFSCSRILAGGKLAS